MCLNLNSLKRNIDLEMQLNHIEFNYSWKINNKIIAKNKDGLKSFENGKWMPYYGIAIPEDKPKIYEDKSYLAYMNCNGEFGGVVHFISKEDGQKYSKEATCANSVFLENNRYYILSHLGHGFGSSDMIQIKDPSLFWNNKYKVQKYERRIITNPDSILNYQKKR